MCGMYSLSRKIKNTASLRKSEEEIAMNIKKCTLNELSSLQEICRRTFAETYGSQNTAENMKKYMDSAYSDEVLSEELSSPDSVTYIAYENSSPIGYMKLNRKGEQTESGYKNSLELQRIYIIPEAKGHGVGSRFIELAEKTAKRLGLEYVWLGVWEKNSAAITFYEDKGFKRFSEHTFVLGDERQTDFLMRKYIN